MTKAQDKLEFFLQHAGLGTWEPEYRFHPSRRWRFDWANTDLRVAVEYDGVMQRNQPGHLSVSGQMRDSEKTNEAQVLGWVVIRVNAKSIESGDAFRWIEQTCHMRMEGAA